MNVPALLPVRRVSLLFHLFPLQMMNLLCELRRPLRKRVAIRVTALPSGSHLHIRRRVVKASQTRVTYNRLSVSAPPHPSFTPSSSSLSFFLLSLGPFSLLVFLILRSYERWHARPRHVISRSSETSRDSCLIFLIIGQPIKTSDSVSPAGRPSLNAFWLFNLFPLSATWTPVCLKQRQVLIPSCVDYVCSLGLPEPGLMSPRWGLGGCIRTLPVPLHSPRLKQSSTSAPFCSLRFRAPGSTANFRLDS